MYAEQASALDGYFIDQSYFVMGGWACLFVVGFGLIMSSRWPSGVSRKPPQEFPLVVTPPTVE